MFFCVGGNIKIKLVVESPGTLTSEIAVINSARSSSSIEFHVSEVISGV